MNRGSAIRTNRHPYDSPAKRFHANAEKYPLITFLLTLTIITSLVPFTFLFFVVFVESSDPPFKIEIETNSSSETALNQTALHRQFNKIYTYLTSAGNDEVFPPSFKMNVKNGKTDTGIALAVFFLVFFTLFISGLGLYGIDMEEPKLIIPFHIYWYIFTFMTMGLSVAVLMSNTEKEARKNDALFKSPGIVKEEVILFLTMIGWLCLVMLAYGVLLFIGVGIRLELKKMRIAKSQMTPCPSAPDLATCYA